MRPVPNADVRKPEESHSGFYPDALPQELEPAAVAPRPEAVANGTRPVSDEGFFDLSQFRKETHSILLSQYSPIEHR
jgi:hypothetical protein